MFHYLAGTKGPRFLQIISCLALRRACSDAPAEVFAKSAPQKRINKTSMKHVSLNHQFTGIFLLPYS